MIEEVSKDYTLKKYISEQFRLEIESDTNITTVFHRDKEVLKRRAKQEAKKGNSSQLWELQEEYKV